MSQSYADHEARARLDRIETNQREIERVLGDLQKQAAVQTEIQGGVLKDQDRLSKMLEKIGARLEADEKETIAFRNGQAFVAGKNQTLWAVAGFMAMAIVGVIASVITNFLSRVWPG